jgi:hypothetical protein
VMHDSQLRTRAVLVHGKLGLPGPGHCQARLVFSLSPLKCPLLGPDMNQLACRRQHQQSRRKLGNLHGTAILALSTSRRNQAPTGRERQAPPGHPLAIMRQTATQCATPTARGS